VCNVLLKIYPLFLFLTCFTFIAVSFLSGLKHKSSEFKMMGIRFVQGCFVAVLVIVGPLFAHYGFYVNKVLPVLSKIYFTKADCVECHSWPVAYGRAGILLFFVLWVVTTLCFSVFATRWVRTREGRDLAYASMSFTLVMALMVYIPNTSYDYSLILLIPLFSVLSFSAELESDALLKAGFITLLLGALLPRWIHTLLFWELSFSTLLVLQTAGLIILSLTLVRRAMGTRT